MTHRFTQATNVFANLDVNIKIVDIYNAFYKKLNDAKIIVDDLNFTQSKTLIEFINKLKIAI